MKLFKYVGMTLLCGALLFGQTSCGSMTNLGKGTLFGGAGGGALGAGIGALIGGGKGAAIGAGVGAAVGAGVGAIIGKKMDKQQKELEEQLKNQAQIESITLENGLQAIRVVFDGGILFPTNSSTLSSQAQSSLANFAANINENPGTDVYIFGFTDNTGSMAANEKVSTNRANSVKSYLQNKGVNATRLSSKGVPMDYYVATNETAEGRAQNRRVEVYITASEEMIQQAENGQLQ